MLNFETVYEASTQVYLTEVIESRLESAESFGNFSQKKRNTSFQVIKKWKGETNSFDTISKSGLLETCEKLFDLQAGDQYYFFLSDNKSDHLLNMCSLVFWSDRSSPFVDKLLGK